MHGKKCRKKKSAGDFIQSCRRSQSARRRQSAVPQAEQRWRDSCEKNLRHRFVCAPQKIFGAKKIHRENFLPLLADRPKLADQKSPRVRARLFHVAKIHTLWQKFCRGLHDIWTRENFAREGLCLSSGVDSSPLDIGTSLADLIKPLAL